MDKQYHKQYDIQYHDLPHDERAHLEAAMTATTEQERADALNAYARLRAQKRRYERKRADEDRTRRTMLAVHVPYDYAQMVREEAEQRDMSVYQFIKRAIDRAMEEPTNAPAG